MPGAGRGAPVSLKEDATETTQRHRHSALALGRDPARKATRAAFTNWGRTTFTLGGYQFRCTFTAKFQLRSPLR
jgi:hypothetical protein